MYLFKFLNPNQFINLTQNMGLLSYTFNTINTSLVIGRNDKRPKIVRKTINNV